MEKSIDITVWLLCSILGLLATSVYCQGDNNWNTWEPWNNNPVGESTFFMDKQTDCDDRIREVGDQSTTVYGHGAVKNDAVTFSCSLTLNTDSPRNPKRFRIEVVSAKIENENEFYIYDGHDGSRGGNVLDHFSKNKPPGQNYDYLFTTGGRVTFLLVRPYKDNDEEEFHYNIEVHVVPIPASIVDGTLNDCTSADQFGCYDYYRFQYKFPNEIVVGIIGGVFLLCFVIVLVITICCYRKYSGGSKRWKEAPLSYINTGASIPSTAGSLRNTQTNTRPSTGWDKSSRGTSLPPKSRMIRPSEDADSVFESVESLPVKKRWSPPQRRGPGRSLPRTSTKNNNNRRVREDPDFDDMETSFVQGDDDHPQNVFVERVIEPRVKPKKINPYYDDSPQAEPRHPKPKQMTTTGTDPGSEVEESEESDEETDAQTEEESDNEPVEPQYSKPVKKTSPPQAPPLPQEAVPQHSASQEKQGNQESLPLQPGMMAQGYPPNQFPPRPLRFVGPHPVYAGNFAPPTYNQVLMGEGRPIPPGLNQLHAVPPGPNQFRPVHPGPMQPVRFPITSGHTGKPQPAQQPPVMNQNNPPMFSYIVQRGYTPQDGRNSPMSSSGASNLSDHRLHTDESDVGANIDSGVELMKRHTEV